MAMGSPRSSPCWPARSQAWPSSRTPHSGLVGLRYASKAALLGAVWPPISLELDASSPFWPVAQGAATREISRNVHPAAQGAAQVATNSTDVNRGAAETGSA